MKQGFVLGACLLLAIAVDGVAAQGPSAKLTDDEKLTLITAHGDTLDRIERVRGFPREGEINAVGRLVTIGRKTYFKTADQSFMPKDNRFPYPELFFELHLSESYAYRPLIEADITKKHRVLYDGPLRIRGNWAYEGAFHIFGVVWVDDVTKVAESPEADWGPWLKEHRPAKSSTNPSND